MIIRIRDHDRAVFYAGGTTRAFIFYDVPGFLGQGYLKVPSFPFNMLNLGIRQHLYVGMPADLDQFGSENSHGAVIGGIGLVKLRHMAADGRGLFNKVDLKARGGKIKRGLNTADPSANHHDVPKLILIETLGKLSKFFSYR